MKRKIIFLVVNNFFTKKYYYDLHIDIISKYFEVEMWCALKLFSLKMHDELESLGMPDQLENVINIDSIEELDNKLHGLSDFPIIITQFFYVVNLREAFLTIKKYNGILIDFDKDSFAKYLDRKIIVNSNKSSIPKKILYSLSFSKVFRKLYWKVRFGGDIPDYSLCPPKLNYNPSKKHIKIHYFKYDSHLDSLKEPALLNQKYAVFLDVNLPFLSDIIVNNSEESVEPVKYYKLLNEFFDSVEERFGIDVVIAPHPKAMYTDQTFNGRKIIKYQTANLIYNSEFVFTHYTSSNINAILAAKPLIFIYYDEMLKKGPNIIGDKLIQFAKILKAPLINIEKTKDFYPVMDNRAYSSFTRKFIMNRKEKNKRNEDLIIDFLNKLVK